MNKLDIRPTDKLVFELEMLQIDYNEERERSLKQEISDKYNVPLKNIIIDFRPLSVDKNGDKISLTSDIIDNIQEPKFQQNLIKEYLETKNIEDVDLEEIIKIDNLINDMVNFDSYSKCKNYKFKYVKWDNYLSYGKDNYFDFSKLNGLVLLNSYPENQSGKTTFAIELLRFALFGKALKSPTNDSVFNEFLPEETEVVVEACLEIDNVDYVIRRTITRPPLKKRTKKSKSKQKVEYFKLINGNYDLIESCEEESTAQTNNVIKNTVGSVDDFNLVISATSDSLSDLLKMGQTEQGRLFSRWLGLVTLEDKEVQTKNYYKTKIFPTLKSNIYNRTVLENEINDYDIVINGNNKEIILEEEKKDKSNENIEKFNQEKVSILSKRKEVNEQFKIDVATVESNIKRNNEELEIKKSQLQQLKQNYEILKNITFDEDEYKNKKNEISELQTRNGELRGLISSLKNEIKKIEELIKNKICPTCNQEINISEKTNHIDEINEKIANMIQEGVKNKENIEKYQKIVAKIEEDKENVNKRNVILAKKEAIEVNIDNISLKIKELEKQKAEFEKNKENIAFNNEINNKIRIVDENIKVETRIKEDCIRKIENLKSENLNYSKESAKKQELIKELIEEEKIVRNWSIYQELMGKNGIIKLVLKQALPVINNEIKRLLNGLCDFDVVLSVSDDNKICLDLYHDGHYLPLNRSASGFERCISSLALRCALGNIATMPKSNMLVLDEILGGLGTSNRENIIQLYRRVLSSYDFIIHICHDNTLLDYHDHIITVTKNNNVSVIETK